MSEIDTESSFTLEPNNMTEIHRDSNLEIMHNSRRTDSGFLIEEHRLPNCVPLVAPKIPRTSWVWKHGIHLGRVKGSAEPISHWLCLRCYEKPAQDRPQLKDYLIRSNTSTNRIIDHMEQRHGYLRNGLATGSPTTKKRKLNTIEGSWQRQQSLAKETFNIPGWQSQYCRWIAITGVSLRQATHPETIALLSWQHPQLGQLPPVSHGTAALWMKQCFKASQAVVIDSIAGAIGKVTISFDGWKANNDIMDLLGVVVHYIDRSYTLKNVVIGLRNTHGSHTGASIADHLFAVLHDYQICGSQIAYFASDNAANNHTALQHLQPKIADLHPVTSRLRCAGHIYNLVCNAILYGYNEEASFDASQSVDEPADCDSATVTNFDAAINIDDDERRLREWRKKGPIGRLHNTMVHINHNPHRRGLFERRQRDVLDEAGDPLNTKIYRAIVNGGIRWNSTYLMIKRAIKLKEAIHNYQDDVEIDMPSEDYLTPNDWLELRELHALLEPLYEASIRVQNKGTKEGALHDVLTSMDYCLTQLEDAKKKLTKTSTITWRTSVNLGWQKLDQYYHMTDDNPAYTIAIVLHPCMKFKWFEKHWDHKGGSFKKAKDMIIAAYEKQKVKYSHLVPVRTTPKRDLKGIDAYNEVDNGDKHNDDELQRWLRDERPPTGTDPLQWWKEHQHDYPILKNLAFTLLAAPASTATDERLFSMAGNVVNEKRPHTKEDLAESGQCLRSWYTEAII